MTTARKAIFFAACVSIIGCFGGCDEEDTTPPLFVATVRGMWPCVVQAGQNITLYGEFSSVHSANIGGDPCTIVSKTTGSMVLKLPANAKSAPIYMSDSRFRSVGVTDQVTVGIDTPVPEIEPNDSVDGSNATPMLGHTIATGVLMPGENDHFKRDCFMTGARYRIRVNPPFVNTVYVNGVGVPLTAGSGEFTATTKTCLMGLTGASGAYTLSVEFVSPN